VKNSIKVCFTLIGTVIGAGFASGQEIVQFFNMFGHNGIYGIWLAAVLFGVITAIVCDYVYTKKIKNYNQLIIPVAGKLGGNIIDFFITLFLIFTFFIMCAGTGAYVEQYFDIPRITGTIKMTIICGIIFLFDIRGMVNMHIILTPLMISGILLIGALNSNIISVFNASDLSNGILNNWLNSSILYVSYNGIIVTTVLACMLPYIDSRKTIYFSSVALTIFLGVLSIILFNTIDNFSPQIYNYELPILYAADTYGRGVSLIYSFILIFAKISSAVSTGYCFLNKLSFNNVKIYKLNITIFFIIAIIISNFGFSNLVKTVYRR
jgi:uncharacterized membrane protein YkvI